MATGDARITGERLFTVQEGCDARDSHKMGTKNMQAMDVIIGTVASISQLHVL